MNNKLQGKDLINIGIFTAIYFMMICSVKIGEELSQAALTRGLGGPVKRTNICKLGFHVQDVIFLLICLGAFAAQIYVLAARG